MGLIYVVSVSWGGGVGWYSCRSGSVVLPMLPDRRASSSISAHGPLTAPWITVLGPSSLHMALGAKVLTQLFCTRESSLKCQVGGLCMRHPASKWNSTKHKGKEKRLDFILLPRFYFSFQRIVGGLCWWLFHHSPTSWNIKGTILHLMIVSFVTCGDDEEKDSNFSPVPEGPKKGRHRYNQFCLLEFDGAPEISGSPWCPSFKEDSWVLFKWEREGSRHQGAREPGLGSWVRG